MPLINRLMALINRLMQLITQNASNWPMNAINEQKVSLINRRKQQRNKHAVGQSLASCLYGLKGWRVMPHVFQVLVRQCEQQKQLQWPSRTINCLFRSIDSIILRVNNMNLLWACNLLILDENSKAHCEQIPNYIRLKTRFEQIPCLMQLKLETKCEELAPLDLMIWNKLWIHTLNRCQFLELQSLCIQVSGPLKSN